MSGNVLRRYENRVLGNPCVLYKDCRQNGGLVCRKDKHLQRDILLKGPLKHKIHQLSGHISLFGTSQYSDKLNLAESGSFLHHGRRGGLFLESIAWFSMAPVSPAFKNRSRT
jgi:hypothetical protein